MPGPFFMTHEEISAMVREEIAEDGVVFPYWLASRLFREAKIDGTQMDVRLAVDAVINNMIAAGLLEADLWSYNTAYRPPNLLTRLALLPESQPHDARLPHSP